MRQPTQRRQEYLGYVPIDRVRDEGDESHVLIPESAHEVRVGVNERRYRIWRGRRPRARGGEIRSIVMRYSVGEIEGVNVTQY